MTVGNTFTPPDAAEPSWAWLQSGIAQFMVTTASEPVIPAQAVLFYLYVEDVAAKHGELRTAGVRPATSNIRSSRTTRRVSNHRSRRVCFDDHTHLIPLWVCNFDCIVPIGFCYHAPINVQDAQEGAKCLDPD
ncbi:MAG TPA: hypothetical protein VGQ46_11780 [Thermoanaerobaculia bacterium]|nr:hypothetical protein [Thermoanaerobaculia bacterium]